MMLAPPELVDSVLRPAVLQSVRIAPFPEDFTKDGQVWTQMEKGAPYPCLSV